MFRKIIVIVTTGFLVPVFAIFCVFLFAVFLAFHNGEIITRADGTQAFIELDYATWKQQAADCHGATRTYCMIYPIANTNTIANDNKEKVTSVATFVSAFFFLLYPALLSFSFTRRITELKQKHRARSKFLALGLLAAIVYWILLFKLAAYSPHIIQYVDLESLVIFMFPLLSVPCLFALSIFHARGYN